MVTKAKNCKKRCRPEKKKSRKATVMKRMETQTQEEGKCEKPQSIASDRRLSRFHSRRWFPRYGSSVNTLWDNDNTRVTYAHVQFPFP